ncbi:YkvA family protein [Polaromonas sp. UC242_47]|uniref:YkvA family protein n=1 Tax=Polaromonas sp. UC242_47 TaxID=3374626 RepID=UPI0037A44C44
MSVADRLRRWAKKIKRDGVTLWFAVQDPFVPWYAKALGIFVVAYALSPIDLIPDFIPVLGYLDDVILLPGLIWLTIRMIPAPVLADCRDRADQWMKTQGNKPSSRAGAAFIVAIWIGATFALWHWVIGPWLGA